MSENYTVKQIEKYREEYGKRGATTIKLLGKMVGFIEAMNSPIGFELLKDDIARMEELLEKVVNETADEKEKAEFRYLKNDRLPKVSQRIASFIKISNEVSGKKTNKEEA